MNPILNALAKGYNVNQVLKYLTQAFPKVGSKISAATAAGYTTNQILNFLSDDVQTQFDSSYRTSNKITAQKRKENDEKVKSLIKAGVGVSAGVLGTLALSSLTSAPSTGAIRPTAILPPLRTPPSPRGLPAPQAQRGLPAPARATPQPTTPTPTPPIAPAAQIPRITTPPTPQAPISPTSPIPIAPKINAAQILTNAGVTGLIDTLGVKNPPAVIAETLKVLNKNAVKNIQTAAPGIELENIIAEYMQQKPPQEQQLAPPIQSIQTPESIVPEQTKPIQEPIQAKPEPIAPIEEEAPIIGNLAILPDGKIGEIENIRQGIVTIDVAGKKSNRKLEDLEIADPNIIKRAEIIIKPEDVPENLRSSSLGIVNVPKSRKDIDVMFGPTGKFYRYYRKDGKPLEENTISDIKEGVRIPISSGDTYMGAFDASKGDSRGTVAHHDLKIKAQSFEKVKNGDEANDPEKQLWYEELDTPFIHGFITQFLNTLKEQSKLYEKAKRAKEPKERKKRSPKKPS